MDGCIIAYPYGNDEVLTYLMEHDIPTVAINADPDRPGLPWVVHTDYVAPIQAILERFYRHGARKIALVSGTEDNAWNRQTSDAYRSEEHTSELQSLMRISYAVFCLKKKKIYSRTITTAFAQYYR